MADLRAVKFAVAFLSAPQRVVPGEIDSARLALTVRGLGALARSGFALPNSPHYDDEIQQMRYARTVGGRFGHLEPTEPFCHLVERVLEPGTTWPAYGATPVETPWADSATFAAALGDAVRYALRLAAGAPAGTRPVCPEPREPVVLVGVSLYRSGLIGCGMSAASDLATAVAEATAVALADTRYVDGPPGAAFGDGLGSAATKQAVGRTTAVVTLLVRPRVLGAVAADRLPLFFRLGRDTLQVSGDGKRGLVLAHFAAQQNLDEQGYRNQVLRKADLSGRPGSWTAYETLAWVVEGRGQARLELGYPDRRNAPHGAGGDPALGGERSAHELARQIAGFIVRQRLEDGLPAYAYAPWTDRATADGTATRVLIAATALAEAGPLLGEEVAAAAESIADRFLRFGRVHVPRQGLTWDVAAQAQLVQLLTALQPREDRLDAVASLTRRLRALVRPDGAIHHGTGRMTADLDLLSGSALLALARAAVWTGDALDDVDVVGVLRFSRRRFRLAHPWGMVWWHSQAWAALARSDRRAECQSGHQTSRTAEQAECGDFVREMLDWALDRQSRVSGAFVIDGLQPSRVSFLSGCVLEGVAEGWALAREQGDDVGAGRYAESWHRGVRFLDRLTLHADDVFFCPRPSAAIGGVRAVLPSSELRIDAAGHALRALVRGLSAAAPGEATHHQRTTPVDTAGGP
jgi:hypothetical protein